MNTTDDNAQGRLQLRRATAADRQGASRRVRLATVATGAGALAGAGVLTLLVAGGVPTSLASTATASTPSSSSSGTSSSSSGTSSSSSGTSSSSSESGSASTAVTSPASQSAVSQSGGS